MAGDTRALTNREKAVAAAAATGATNRRIADELFLSPRTVEHHLASIYRKLGLRARGELIAHMAQQRPAPARPQAPETRYARGGDVAIAYQVLGDGPVDLVLVQGLVSHLEVLHEDPLYAAWVEQIARHCRLILFDKRGTGLSDPLPIRHPPSLQERMDDLRLVMDAAGSRRAVVLGGSEGAAMSILYAATHPERVAGLILYGGWAHRPSPGDDFEVQHHLDAIERSWGSGEFLRMITPSSDDGGERAERMARIERFGASPGMVRALAQLSLQTDVREILHTVRVPTMVLHRTGDAGVPVERARAMAAAIPGARMVELPGDDHYPWYGDAAATVRAIVDFLQEATCEPATDTALVTVLAATDPEALRAGSGRITAAGGRLADSSEGPVALFDRPVTAVRCAMGIVGEVAARNGTAALGVHIGECEARANRVDGPPISLARSLASAAPAAGVLATSTVRDLTMGSGFTFTDAGTVDAGTGPVPSFAVGG